MLKLPMPEQTLIKPGSKELEETSSALMLLNSLVNTSLPVTKKQVLLSPPRPPFFNQPIDMRKLKAQLKADG